MEVTPSQANMSIRIMLIDHHTIVRAALRMLIENQPGFTVVGEADNYSAAVTVARQVQPDIILLDLVMGNESGLDYLPSLRDVAEQSRILILTSVDEPKLEHLALQKGAMGIVQKSEAPEILMKAIAVVHAGEAWLDRVTMANVLSSISRMGKENGEGSERQKINSLTKRELDIIRLVAQGLKNKQVAERLFISNVTVRHHLTSIFSKLGVSDRFELIIYAYRHNLCERPDAR